MGKHFKNYFINLIVPAFVFAFVTGSFTALVITLYKYLAKHVVGYSQTAYAFVAAHPYLIPVGLIALFGLAFLFKFIYKKVPSLKGGGIPTSISVLRDIVSFKWLRTLIGVFFMSLVGFLIGLPLGSEGPSVQMGTAIGKGCISPLKKKHGAWRRYSMTGGACAGFAVATGAPISGVMFAIEEAHQRISPMIIMVSATAVMFASLIAELLAPIFGVSTALFPSLTLPTLSISEIWIPLVVGVVVGLFSVLFLRYYRLISKLFKKVLKSVPVQYKIFAVFALTFILGICSFSFISTGHELILSLFLNRPQIWMLVLILIVRATLTLSCNTNGLTGGMFLPILALGTVISSVLGSLAVSLLGVNEQYYSLILVIGITSCISGMMKMPLTAIFFSVEALSCSTNIIYVIVAAVISFVITEIFREVSINDIVVENKQKEVDLGKTAVTVETLVTVNKSSFAEGKQMRDILWPHGLHVLAVKKKRAISEQNASSYGGYVMREGDVIHIRYTTFNEQNLIRQLYDIVGEEQSNE